MPRNNANNSKEEQGQGVPAPGHDAPPEDPPSDSLPPEMDPNVQATWIDWDHHVREFVASVQRPRTEAPVLHALGEFGALTRQLRALFTAGEVLVRMGKHSSDDGEKESAVKLEKDIRDVCLTAIGDWFADFLRANSVFLVNFRELLKEHEGEYVLIGLDQKTAQWGFLAFSHDAKELGKKAEELRPARCFIERIVEGVETVPELDFSRPETFGDRPGDSQSQLTDGGTGD